MLSSVAVKLQNSAHLPSFHPLVSQDLLLQKNETVNGITRPAYDHVEVKQLQKQLIKQTCLIKYKATCRCEDLKKSETQIVGKKREERNISNTEEIKMTGY